MKRITYLLVVSLLIGCGGGSGGGETSGSGSSPIVTTLTATSITPTSAILNGTGIPNGLQTQSWFEYGTDSALATYTTSSMQDAGSGLTSQAANMTWSGLAVGTTYYFRFCAENSKGYSKGLIGSFTTSSPGAAPTVSTLAVTSVAATGAALNGSVTPNGLPTTAWFEWGADPTLASYASTPAQSVESGTTSQLVSAAQSGLSTGTTYYCRVAANNSTGTSKGTIVSFTPGVAPTVNTLAATSVLATSATLNGNVTPNGLATTAWFEWGTDSSMTIYSTTETQSVGSGTASRLVSVPLSGLSTGATYYFRVAASNGSATLRGTIASFTPGAAPTITVRPIETSDILYNPGMGFADFHFGWGNPPPPSQYPPQTVAYFRWTWDELEPSEGQYNFGLVDSVIQQAKVKGETLAFRIMSVSEGSTPKWVRDKGVNSVTVGSDIFPDHNNSVFLDYHERLVKAFGNRYAGTPEIDHVDIGSVGCWGEWNTACCGASEAALCTQYLPTDQNKIRITDWYFQYFPGTPLVMLVGGPKEYAASKGAGWRGDCFGDYGMFDPTWNHMVDVYQPAVQIPVVGNAWKAGPVQFEVCGVMQDWYDLGFNIDLILQKGLDWHMTVFNAKSSPVPAAWRPKVDEFLKRVGYRFVLQDLTHTTEARPGGSLPVRSHWENKGVAPIYHPWPLAYRLRSNTDQVVASWKSAANLMTWLPGTHQVDEVVTIPPGVPAATYALDVAILTEDAKAAHVEIAIVGKRLDKWYPVSEVTINK